ncbi:hypothetical protein [Salirhabdus sp. Marseille-P4669]|nr:hypothetical protein [Salirhabdus sp. Marseille-P4669]
MNTIYTYEALIEEFECKLKRKLNKSEMNFLNWLSDQYLEGNQWKRTGKF